MMTRKSYLKKEQNSEHFLKVINLFFPNGDDLISPAPKQKTKRIPSIVDSNILVGRGSSNKQKSNSAFS